MKKLITTILLIVSFGSMYGQSLKGEEKSPTKMDLFISKRGSSIKYIDYKFPMSRGGATFMDSNIKKVINNSEISYFYQVKTASQAFIEYSDLLEIIKVIEVMRSESDKDLLLLPEYLENKFTTNENVQVGYYIENNKVSWAIVPNINTIEPSPFVVKEYGQFLKMFITAKDRIEQLKLKD